MESISKVQRQDSEKWLFIEKVSMPALKDALGITGEVPHNVFEDAKDAVLVYKKLSGLLLLLFRG